VAKHSAVDVRRAGQTPTDDLARARAAADAGRLDEAVRVCDEILAADPANAEALYLIGLVWVSRGQSLQAEGVFQKTLYLDPRHQGAMVHLMLLAQRRGDEQAAARLRQRAQRTEDEEERG
jgi:chemotaxis protein methyltransferase WspC